MVKFVATTISGQEHELRHIVQFKLCSNIVVPADSLVLNAITDDCLFEFAFIKMYIDEGLFFDGVVDEQVTRQRTTRFELRIAARSRVAILLDNQARPGIYKNISLGEIFERHVKCYGFSEMKADSNPRLEELLIKMGSSEWHVLDLFCKRTIGIKPKIGVNGILNLKKEWRGKSLLFKNSGGGQIYAEMIVVNRRYGIVSSVHYKGTDHKYSMCVTNPRAMGHGIVMKRYLEIPREFSGDGLRYVQEYLKGKNVKCGTVNILVPGVIDVCVGDRVTLESARVNFEGLVVSGVEHEMNSSKMVTRVETFKERG
ncbi:MAG: hypothetical protein LBJ83_01005 [Oscillospiraceae bacterium]|jgi:hypothetical protein|nr:hypothetical protein [Oscillospiraceae bacterium]